MQTGRSNTGRLRNFGAMSDDKATDVLYSLLVEANDAEALQYFADARWDKLSYTEALAIRQLARRV